jgi:hypothetical protein
VVKGVVTDADPTTTSTVTLQNVWITDPSPAMLGDPAIERFISASTWFSEFSTVTKATSAYNGEYVAVIEPPEKKGTVRPWIPEIRMGRVLEVDFILASSRRWLESTDFLREVKPFAPIYRSEPQQPLLVDAEEGGYYLVPFSEDGKRASRALLLNAYKGNFQEVGVFAPVRFLAQREAVERASQFWESEGKSGKGGEMETVRARYRELRRKPKASLHYAPEAGSSSRYHPVWRVTDGRRTVAVRQDGTVREWPKPKLRRGVEAAAPMRIQPCCASRGRRVFERVGPRPARVSA